ncbi:MAG: hypothetical protein WEC84_04365 [Candidatus Andersenbacteria bacterium]
MSYLVFLEKVTSRVWIALGILLIIFLSLFTASHSLWFLTALIKDDSASVTAGGNHSALSLIGTQVPEEIQSSHWQTFVYNQQEEGGRVQAIGIAKWFQGRALIRDLRQQGFEPRRLGWVVLVGDRYVERSSILKNVPAGFASLVLHKATNNHPSFPDAVASIRKDSYPLIHADTAMIATMNSSVLRLAVKEQTTALEDVLWEDDVFAHQGDADKPDIAVVAQSDVLESMPEISSSNLNDYLLEQLGFVYTAPDLVGFSTGFPARLVALQRGSDIVFGLQGASLEEEMALQEAILAEAGYDYPTRHAFLLPDRTLGYEYIPDKEQVLIGEPSMPSGCSALVIHQRDMWVCKKEGIIAVSTSATLTDELFENAQQTYSSVQLAEPFLQSTSQQLRAMNFLQQENQSHIEIEYKELEVAI